MENSFDDNEYTLLVDIARELLIVEDDETIAATLERFLESKGYTTHLADSFSEALRCLEEFDIAVLIADKVLPDGRGEDLIRLCRSLSPHTVSIMVTGHASIESVIEALRLGAFDYLEKPYSLDILAHKVEQAFEKALLHRENAVLLEHLRETNRELHSLLEGISQRKHAPVAAVSPKILLQKAKAVIKATVEINELLSETSPTAPISRPLEALGQIADDLVAMAQTSSLLHLDVIQGDDDDGEDDWTLIPRTEEEEPSGQRRSHGS